ncbi:IclR family transcriptional regulator [Aeromicrobium sp. PE09-221]|uniref:IclR family transcriptional regulator n=1 Tax=Aeromicrobium sp. PE09-221 TaxID=1898043 RepID=UPI000B3ED0FC|nr:IclR family transcriptional regulator [Aeromicrobium sp. PE09-221]
MPQTPPHVVARVGAVLRAVAASEPDGVTTTEVGRASGLARATAHRLLVSLSDEGLVDRDHRSGRWSLGPELYLLGIASARRYDVADVARPVVERLARETGESAFFSARRGDETVCLLAEDGSFPLRSHVLHVGIRFPLGVASAGMAILAHLPSRESEEYLNRVDPEVLAGHGHDVYQVRVGIAQTRETGYAVNPGLLVQGSWGMGAVVFDRDDRPAWALSLTGVEARFGPDRRPELGAALLESAHALSKAIVASARR